MLKRFPQPNHKLGLRFLFYVLGLFILAMGVAVSINSKLGVSPVSSLPYVISLVTGFNMGLTTILVYIFFVTLQILLLRQEFRLIHLTQMLFSVLFGYFIDFSKYLVGDFVLPGYPGRLVMMGVSILLISVGVTLYVNVHLINMPMEALTAAVRKKLFPRLMFSDVKMMLDTMVVTISILFSLAFLGGVQGVREGTVLAALLVGRVMKLIHPIITPWLDRVCFDHPKSA